MARGYRSRTDGIGPPDIGLAGIGLADMVTRMATGLLDGLDEEQRHAVTTPSRLVAVIAGAGSGKTRVLTRRVAYRIEEGSADPRHTLVLTFTREAAGELRRRLPRLGLRDRIEAGTFHSVMLAILRQHWTDSGVPQPLILSDRSRLLNEILGRRSAEGIRLEIDQACARGIAPTSDRARVLFDDYQSVKRRRGLIDLDDVLVRAADLLEGDPGFAEIAQWRYRHLLVDEAQDLNPVQHRLVDLLRRGHDDVFLVGDPAQAIYGFNGADPSLLNEVAERFPGVEIVRLQTNHRCSPQVVDIGRQIITSASMTATALQSGRPDGPAVRVVTFDDEQAEVNGVTSWILGLDPEAVRRSDIAVLARTHAQLEPFRVALSAAGIGIRQQVSGPGSVYRSSIDAAQRCSSASALRSWAHELLDHLDPETTGSRPDQAAVEVATVVLDFLREQPFGDGVGLRTWIATTDPFGERDGGVELLTFHGSKGREWASVAVTGVETGLVPHRSATTNEARAEEARLLYVAVTRASTSLIVTSAGRRGGYRRKPSPLLENYLPTLETVTPPPTDLTGRVGRAPRDPVRAALEEWRRETARASNILPEQVCSDAVLNAIIRQRPASTEQLASITGPITAQRWFPEIAPLITGSGSQARRSTKTGA